MTPVGPLVSIVLPTANRRERLGTALSSALAQTYGHLEVIVVDDASASPVDDIVEAAADPRARLLRRPVNGGAAAARNTGLKEARAISSPSSTTTTAGIRSRSPGRWRSWTRTPTSAS